MSRSRNLADLLESTGDVKATHLDNTTSVTVTDNVTSTSTTEALSANQGKELKTLVDGKQASDAQLTDVAGLAVTDGNFIVGDGSNFVAESAGTARTSLGLAIGTDVQAYDADLATLATNGIGTSANQIVQLDGTAKLPAVDGSNLTGVDSLPTQTSQSGKFLTTNGSAASWGDAGGAWSVKTSGSISGSLSITGLTKTTKVIISNLQNATGGGGVFSQLGVGSSYQTGYAYAVDQNWSDSSYTSYYGGLSATYMRHGDLDLPSGGGRYNMYIEYTIQDPSNSSTRSLVMQSSVLHNNSYDCVRFSGGYSRNATGAHTSFKVFPEAGTLSGGTYVILELN